MLAGKISALKDFPNCFWDSVVKLPLLLETRRDNWKPFSDNTSLYPLKKKNGKCLEWFASELQKTLKSKARV